MKKYPPFVQLLDDVAEYTNGYELPRSTAAYLARVAKLYWAECNRQLQTEIQKYGAEIEEAFWLEIEQKLRGE